MLNLFQKLYYGCFASNNSIYSKIIKSYDNENGEDLAFLMNSLKPSFFNVFVQPKSFGNEYNSSVKISENYHYIISKYIDNTNKINLFATNAIYKTAKYYEDFNRFDQQDTIEKIIEKFDVYEAIKFVYHNQLPITKDIYKQIVENLDLNNPLNVKYFSMIMEMQIKEADKDLDDYGLTVDEFKSVLKDYYSYFKDLEVLLFDITKDNATLIIDLESQANDILAEIKQYYIEFPDEERVILSNNDIEIIYLQ